MYSSGSFDFLNTGVTPLKTYAISGYIGNLQLKDKPRGRWVNNPDEIGHDKFIWSIGSPDPVYEIINGRTVKYVRRYAEIETPKEPRENRRPAPAPKGTRKEIRIGGFGENQKLKI